MSVDTIFGCRLPSFVSSFSDTVTYPTRKRWGARWRAPSVLRGRWASRAISPPEKSWSRSCTPPGCLPSETSYSWVRYIHRWMVPWCCLVILLLLYAHVVRCNLHLKVPLCVSAPGLIRSRGRGSSGSSARRMLWLDQDTASNASKHLCVCVCVPAGLVVTKCDCSTRLSEVESSPPTYRQPA